MNDVSLSANLHKKGDRVIVKTNTNEWYTGTVQRSGAKIMKIEFDDGMTASIEEEDFKDVRAMLLDYRSDEPLTNEEAKRLYEKSKQPGAKARVRVKLTPEEAPKKITPEDQRLLPFLQPRLYEVAQKSNSSSTKLRWIEAQYTALTREFFGNKMQRPAIAVMPLTEEHKTKCRGLWKAMQRQLLLGQSLFELSELRVLKQLLQLMCHQAVSEIDRRVSGGHDQYFGQWTYKASIPMYMQEELMHEVPLMLKFQPKDAKDLPMVAAPAGKREVATLGYERITVPPLNDTPAVLYTKSGVRRRGLVLGQYKQLTNSVIFLSVPSLDQYKEVDLADIYKMPEENQNLVKTPEWRASAARLALALKLKPMIQRLNDVAMCCVCQTKLDTKRNHGVKIESLPFCLEHGAENLGMTQEALTALLRKHVI